MDVDDVLVVLVIVIFGIVLSRDWDFFWYDRLICVCNGFFVCDGKLFLEFMMIIDIFVKFRFVIRRV